ncbi:hypothetical protein WJX74_002886 [Apatococcus lobatus]|uniref:Uncharacterized protein n=1 Tax=Apatococcus lobatus TaxID=904363 RepID=A0AAW1SFP4_9CHLO
MLKIQGPRTKLEMPSDSDSNSDQEVAALQLTPKSTVAISEGDRGASVYSRTSTPGSQTDSYISAQLRSSPYVAAHLRSPLQDKRSQSPFSPALTMNGLYSPTTGDHKVFATPMDKTPAMAPTPAMDYVKENVAPHSAQQDSNPAHPAQSLPDETSSVSRSHQSIEHLERRLELVEMGQSQHAASDQAVCLEEAEELARRHEAGGQASPRSECSSHGIVSLMMQHVEEELGEYIASLGRRIELLLERSDQLWDMQEEVANGLQHAKETMQEDLHVAKQEMQNAWQADLQQALLTSPLKDALNETALRSLIEKALNQQEAQAEQHANIDIEQLHQRLSNEADALSARIAHLEGLKAEADGQATCIAEQTNVPVQAPSVTSKTCAQSQELAPALQGSVELLGATQRPQGGWLFMMAAIAFFSAISLAAVVNSAWEQHGSLPAT